MFNKTVNKKCIKLGIFRFYIVQLFKNYLDELAHIVGWYCISNYFYYTIFCVINKLKFTNSRQF